MENLINESDCGLIDGELCKLIDFSPYNISGFPYRATVNLECNKFPNGVNGYIYHKEDFDNLSTAFKMKTSTPNTEVIFFWSKKQYKNFIYKALSAFMPRLWVMLCSVGTYKLHTDQNYRPELTGEARYKATIPVKEWKPDVMK